MFAFDQGIRRISRKLHAFDQGYPDIEFITVRHEETTSLMASAYAKLTDQLGVCLSIAGPGATNLMTGLYDAKMDRAPVLAITGQVALQFIGRDVLQEISIFSGK